MYFDETYGESEKADHSWVRSDVTKLDESGGRNRGRVEKNWRDGGNRDDAEKLEGHFGTRMTTIHHIDKEITTFPGSFPKTTFSPHPLRQARVNCSSILISI